MLYSVFFMKTNRYLLLFLFVIGWACTDSRKDPVDYVNPYMGNISHLLVPTYPTVHLPNSMLRVYPERADYTSDRINGLPLIVTSHRGSSAFNLTPFQGETTELKPVGALTYDHEEITPYCYRVWLDEQRTDVRFAPSHQSAVYEIDFTRSEPSYLVLNSRNGAISVDGNRVSGYQQLANNTRVYLFLETEQMPEMSGILDAGNGINRALSEKTGRNVAVVLYFGEQAQKVRLRYGVSFISEDQARKNLEREICGYDWESVAETGREIWNRALGTIRVSGEDENEKTVFYTSLYRCFERPVSISEDGRYFSAFDGQVHEDDGEPFLTDDWIWDTYRATHPLRLLIDQPTELNILRSYLRMAVQMGDYWMPTFPEITGDSRRMNSNHAVATVADAYAKGVTDFDLSLAYDVCRKGIEEKTLAPWSAKPAGWLDDFYKQNGYIPALAAGEEETVPEVHGFEKRQPVAVTLGTSYDEWCLSQLAAALGKNDDADYFLERSYNYRNLYRPDTKFFHPKDKEGRFIEPFDYRFPGGMGAREYYGENNAWVYRWDVQHNVGDLIRLMGGREAFCAELDRTFREPLGRSKFDFYAQLPDHTGNVGQFSMANEPSLHVPYLYNYAGRPWMTQKRIHTLLDQWFRNDLMGVPGDEDGGGMSAFVVFSMMGFYPVTPGMPAYNIGSPFFREVSIDLPNGKKFTVRAPGYSKANKYIRSARLNGVVWDKPWFTHDDLMQGGILELEMSPVAHPDWGTAPDLVPPSAKRID